MELTKIRSEKVTVKSIADYLNVSTGVISAVLNNRHIERRISHSTAERVRLAAKELGYMPNIGARQMRKGMTETSIVIALITSFQAPLSVTDRAMGLVRQLQNSDQKDIRKLTLSLTVEMFSAGRLCDLPGILTGERFNAALITNTTPEDDQFLARNHLPYPVALLNRCIPGYSYNIDSEEMGGIAAEILVRRERVRLAVLHGAPMTQATQRRVDSFMKAGSRLTGQLPQEIVAPCLSEAAADEAVKNFLEQGKSIDGLYCVTDSLAIGAYHALKQKGLRIPDDVAVVGVGDSKASPYLDPPLSTVGSATSYISKSMEQLLLHQLSFKRNEPCVIELPVETHLRRSTEPNTPPRRKTNRE